MPSLKAKPIMLYRLEGQKRCTYVVPNKKAVTIFRRNGLIFR